MNVYPNLKSLAHDWYDLKQPILTIGNFDGFHLGHQALLQTARTFSQSTGKQWGVLTFAPHPREFLCGATIPKLFSDDQKIEALRAFGCNFICSQPFDQEFSQISPDEFLELLCAGTRRASRIIVGDNFHYGKCRKGTVEDLTRFAKRQTMDISVVPCIRDKEGPISSSRLRELLKTRDKLLQINTMLGRQYSITGTVEHGSKIGRTIKVPTANLRDIPQLVPAKGVYCGYARNKAWSSTLQDQYVGAVINIGTNPTVSEENQTKIEVHILDSNLGQDFDLYGKNLEVLFVQDLRSEKKFDSIEDLGLQIQQDIEQAKAILSKTRPRRLPTLP